MPVILPILKDPFADLGDRAEFPYQPDTMQELLSWKEGYTKPYQRIPEHGGVYIERREFNQVLWLLTSQMIWGFNNSASWEELQRKFTNGRDMGIQQFDVKYTVTEPSVVFVKIETQDDIIASQTEYVNFELNLSNSSADMQNPQFVFKAPNIYNAAARPNMVLTAFLSAGASYTITGATNLGITMFGQNTGFFARATWLS